METSPYHGFGRPEATDIVKRLIDKAVRETGHDALTLRQKNLVTPDQMRYQAGMTFHYDCGDFPRIVEEAAMQADYAGFEQRRKQSEAKGLLRGIGISNAIEVAGGPFKQTRNDVARVTASTDSKITIAPGLMSVGVGYKTTVTRLASDLLGVPADMIIYAQGDNDLLPAGRGNGDRRHL